MTMTWSMLAIDEGAPAVVAHAAMARMRAVRTARRFRGMDRSIECARCRPPSPLPTRCSSRSVSELRAGGWGRRARRASACRSSERVRRPRPPALNSDTLLAGRLGAVRDDALRDGGVERFVLVIAD